MDCSLLGSSVHGILQARVLEWGAIASPVCVCVCIYIKLGAPLLWLSFLGFASTFQRLWQALSLFLQALQTVDFFGSFSHTAKAWTVAFPQIKALKTGNTPSLIFFLHMSVSSVSLLWYFPSFQGHCLYLFQCIVAVGSPGGSEGKESACNVGDLGSIPGLGRSPGGGHGNPLQYSYLENPHGQRCLVGYSPWGRQESDTTERLSTVQQT